MHALVAGSNVDLLVRQIERFRPHVAVTATEESHKNLISRLTDVGLPRQSWPELSWGARARVEAATASEVDFVMSAIVGVAGLEATYEAIRRDGTQKNVIDRMQTRADLYKYLDYYAYEAKLDALFAEGKGT